MKHPIFATLFFSLGALNAAQAEIFAGVDAAGNPHFTNGPTTRDGYRIIIFEPKKTKKPLLPLRTSRQPPRLSLRVLINQSALKHGFDAALLAAIIDVESDFNPQARSSKGAAGLMQVMPTTAGQYGISDLYDPAENLNAGITHFKTLLDQHRGNVALSLAAYNAGRTSILRHGQRIPPYPETMIYVSRVLARYEQYRVQTTH